MKKLFLILALCTVFAITACGSSKKTNDNTDSGEAQNDEDVADTEQTDDIEPADSDSTDPNSDNDMSNTDIPTSDDDNGSSNDSDSDSKPVDDADSTDDSNDEEPDGDTVPDEDFTLDEEVTAVPDDQVNTPDAGCVFGTFVEFCDGNTAVRCLEGKVSHENCADKTCMTTKGLHCGRMEGKNVAGCHESCETPKKNVVCEKSDVVSDYKAGGTLSADLCLETSKGKLSFKFTEQCDTPCNEDGTDFVKLNKVPDDQDNTKGAECDYGTFVQFCEGNTMVECYNKQVSRTNCNKKTCLATIDVYGDEDAGRNYTYCYESCEKPADLDEKYCIFNMDLNIAIINNDYCLETSAGYLEFWNVPTEYCENGCAEDGKTCKTE